MTDILTRERIKTLREEDQFFELCAYDFHALIATALAYHDALAKLDRLTVVIAEKDAEIERQAESIDDLSMSWNDLCRRAHSLVSAAREAEKALTDAAVNISYWATYASAYFREKRGLADDIEAAKTAASALRAALPPEPDHQSISEGE